MAPLSSSRKRKADKTAASPSPTKRRSPKKAKSRTTTTTSVRVEVCHNDPAHDPVVVSFPRGVPSSIVANDDKESNSASPPPPQFVCSRLKANSSRGRRVVGEDEVCEYSSSAAGRGHDGRLTKAYVCVYDKRNKTLKLVPSAERGTVFALEQSVKEYTPNVANGSAIVGGSRAGDGEGSRIVSASEHVQMLVESFGSKKKQKVMASRAANKVNIHSVVGAGDVMMDSVTKQEGISLENKKGMEEGSKMVNANEVAYEQARKKMLPPYDANADAPSKVYNAQTIAGTTAWDKVSRIVEKVLSKKTDDGEALDIVAALLGRKGYRPLSIVSLLQSIDPSKKSAPYRIKVAFFLALAMKFHSRIQRRGFIEGASLDDCISTIHVPHEVGARLFELFASPAADGKDGSKGGYVASKQQKSKMSSHLLILYVIACGKNMEVPSVDQFCKDLKLDAKDAALVLREAGFAVKKGGRGGDMGASLSVPLKFPPPKRGKRT